MQHCYAVNRIAVKAIKVPVILDPQALRSVPTACWKGQWRGGLPQTMFCRRLQAARPKA
jgi:hypothetical protein